MPVIAAPAAVHEPRRSAVETLPVAIIAPCIDAAIEIAALDVAPDAALLRLTACLEITPHAWSTGSLHAGAAVAATSNVDARAAAVARTGSAAASAAVILHLNQICCRRHTLSLHLNRSSRPRPGYSHRNAKRGIACDGKQCLSHCSYSSHPIA